MRERLPGQNPIAEDDAALARAGIRRALGAAGLPLRVAAVGLAGAATAALSRDGRNRRPGAGLGWSGPRPISCSPPGGRLDPGARYGGARGPQLPEPVGRAATAGRRRTMTARD